MMDKTKMIKDAISEIIGIEVHIETKDYLEGSLPNKDLFCKMIDSWVAAWDLQNDIYNSYQIDLSGYDDYLYYALEKSMLLLYGEVKTKVILGYLYNKSVAEEEVSTFSNSSELFDYLEMMDEDGGDIIVDFKLNEDE